MTRNDAELTNPKFSGSFTCKIVNEGSTKEIRDLKKRLSFKTFESVDQEFEKDQTIKTVGIGLSTADALVTHLGGKFHIKDFKDIENRSIATEALFTIPACDRENCHHYSNILKQTRFDLLRDLPIAF
ncbi:MAG: hypothetical protein ACKO96_21600 [Flammeovirgaceae bacterium]